GVARVSRAKRLVRRCFAQGDQCADLEPATGVPAHQPEMPQVAEADKGVRVELPPLELGIEVRAARHQHRASTQVSGCGGGLARGGRPQIAQPRQSQQDGRTLSSKCLFELWPHPHVLWVWWLEPDRLAEVEGRKRLRPVSRLLPFLSGLQGP